MNTLLKSHQNVSCLRLENLQHAKQNTILQMNASSHHFLLFSCLCLGIEYLIIFLLMVLNKWTSF